MPPQLKVLEIVGFWGDEASAGIRVGQTFDLVKDRVVFGRHEANDIPLFSFDRSRHHGQLMKVGEDYYIEDFPETPYRTLVNNSPIEGKTLLKDGDVITVHRVKLVYRTHGLLKT